jgi:hypothetical protein
MDHHQISTFKANNLSQNLPSDLRSNFGNEAISKWGKPPFRTHIPGFPGLGAALIAGTGPSRANTVKCHWRAHPDTKASATAGL